jgi:hypothetical protein
MMGRELPRRGEQDTGRDIDGKVYGGEIQGIENGKV